MRKVVNISLPEHLYRDVERAVRDRKYGTKSELFRDILRMWKGGTLREHRTRFNAGLLLRNVEKHAARRGGPRDLSLKHDRYLYGA
jgi:Arc/MetJ-type ribon-helix-helix transcriptional regulator